MKYKIICEVTFPIYERTFDIKIPINKTIYYVCKMLERIIIEEIDPSYVANENSLLIDKKSGIAYDKSVLVKDSNMLNGSKITYF